MVVPPAVEAAETPAAPRDPVTDTRPTTERRTTEPLRWLLAAIVFAGSFIFRFLDPYFYDDHFLWISGGHQILVAGEMPFRDFFDPGYFLQHFTSAGMQLLFGHNLLGEALLSIVLLSAGAAITFVLASRISHSLLIGLLAAVLVVGTYPRLYNYHKIFFYAFALLVFWRYVDRATIGNLVVVALTTALAFLFRHDHGVYLAVPAVGVMVATHWNDWRRLLRRLVVYATFVVLPLLPFFAFLEANGGVVEYFRLAGEWALQRRGAMGARPALVVDPAAPLSILQPANAITWLYYLFLILPFATLLILALQHLRRRRVAAATPPDTPRVLSAAILCAVSAPLLLRTPLEARLADIAAPTAVIGAWLLAQSLGPLRWRELLARSPRSRPRRRLPSRRHVGVGSLPTAFRYLSALGLVGVTWMSIAAVADMPSHLEDSAILDGPRAMLGRGRAVFTKLSASPPDEELYPGDENLPLVRYVRACTKPTDKVLVTWFAPQFYFYAGRAAAGGAIQVDATAKQQARYLQDVPAESVPVVIAVRDEDGDYFRSTFKPIEDYLLEQYRVVLESDLGADRLYRVLADERLVPSGVYRPLSLPCYR